MENQLSELNARIKVCDPKNIADIVYEFLDAQNWTYYVDEQQVKEPMVNVLMDNEWNAVGITYLARTEHGVGMVWVDTGDGQKVLLQSLIHVN